MTQTGSNRRTVLALGIALGAALLAIAFLLGRESAQLPPSRTVEAELSPRRGVEREAEPWAEEQIPRQWREWADLRDEPEQQPAGSTVITTEAIERQTNDKLYRAGTARGADRQPGPPDRYAKQHSRSMLYVKRPLLDPPATENANVCPSGW